MEHSKLVEDKAIKIKLVEITNLLTPLDKRANVSNDDLINLLQYCELVEELHVTHG